MIKMILSIVEGFDKVGKSKIIKDLSDGKGSSGVYDKTFIYKPPYAGLDLKFNRNQAWILGYSSLDFIIQSGMVNQNYHLIMDRHIASSYVYDRLYGDATNVTNDIVSIDLELLNHFDRVTTYYITHSDIQSAKYIYENKNSDHNDKLDYFDDFSAYWDLYNRSTTLFNNFFHDFEMNASLVRLKSVSDETGFITKYI